jgi:UDP-glucose 4-epimerase
VVDALLAAGHSVRVFGRRAEVFRPPLAGVDYRLAELGDASGLASALAGCDAVLHLISTTHPASAERDPIADVQGNLISTLHLLQAMQAAGIRRLLYLSSGGAIYGPPQHLPIAESHPLRPIGSYGIVKAAIESYIALAARWGLVATVLRPSNAFGPRQTGSSNAGFVGTALLHLAQGVPVQVFGDGSIVRDYLFVRDLAELCVLAVQSGEGVTINAGTGGGLSLLAVIDAIRRVTGLTPQLQFLPGRPIDVPVSILDVRQAQQSLGWQARTIFEDALAETWDWIRLQVEASLTAADQDPGRKDQRAANHNL